MVSKAQAIHPTFFNDIRSMLKEKDNEPVEIKEEGQLATMAQQKGWEHLKKYIEELIENLNLLTYRSMESGASYEEIGQKTIISQLTKEYLLKVIEKVENAKDAVENQPGE